MDGPKDKKSTVERTKTGRSFRMHFFDNQFKVDPLCAIDRPVKLKAVNIRTVHFPAFEKFTLELTHKSLFNDIIGLFLRFKVLFNYHLRIIPQKYKSAKSYELIKIENNKKRNRKHS